MPAINRHALVPYTSREIFDLVDEVERYAEFLPWCRRSTVHTRTEIQVDATLDISKAGFSESFSTRNIRSVGESISMSLLDGPFDSLRGAWTFTPLGEMGSRVELNLSYEFSNSVVQILLAPTFAGIVGSLVDAFVKRAEVVYGPK
ncbi:MAG: type II toxin-antitoxin system RatA family toxin [Pseudomonadota bacterium]